MGRIPYFGIMEHTHTHEINTIRVASYWRQVGTMQDGTVVREKHRFEVGYTKRVTINGQSMDVIIQVIEVDDLPNGRTQITVYTSIADKAGLGAKAVDGRISKWITIKVPSNIEVEIESDLSLAVAIGGAR